MLPEERLALCVAVAIVVTVFAVGFFAGWMMPR